MQVNKYKIIKKIGEGGSSEVFLVEDRVLHKIWLMKQIKKKQDVKQETMKEEREIELLKNLSHPAIPRVVDYFSDKKANYYILDYIQGKTLRSVMKEKRITEKQRKTWMLEMIDVLSYLHNCQPAIFYGDLKPENLIVGINGKIHLIDFGSAGRITEIRTKSYGTRGYAAPEQYMNKMGKICLDLRSDIYSLGQVFYELFTGELYVEGKSSFHKVPREYRMFIKKALYSEKEKRYRSMKNMGLELKKMIEQERKRKFLDKMKILIFPILALMIACMSIFFQSGQKVALSETRDLYESMISEANQNRIKGDYKEALFLLYDCILQYPQKEKAYIDFFSIAGTELRRENMEYMIEDILKNTNNDILYHDEVACSVGTYYLAKQKYQKAYTYFSRLQNVKEESREYYLIQITSCLLHFDISLEELKELLIGFQQITKETTNIFEQMLQFQIFNQLTLTFFKKDAKMLELAGEHCEWMIAECCEFLEESDFYSYYEQLGNVKKELGKICKEDEKERKIIYFEEAVSAYLKALNYSGASKVGMEGKLCEIGKIYHEMKEYEKENEIYIQGMAVLGEQGSEIYCVFLNRLMEQYQENTDVEFKNKIQMVIEEGTKIHLEQKNQRWSMLIQTAKERGIYEEE